MIAYGEPLSSHLLGSTTETANLGIPSIKEQCTSIRHFNTYQSRKRGFIMFAVAANYIIRRGVAER